MRYEENCFVKGIAQWKPFLDALIQHTQHAAYQAGIWTASDIVNQDTPNLMVGQWTKLGTRVEDSHLPQRH